MKLEDINAQLLRAIGVGVALLEPKTLTIRYRNEAFGDWFDDAKPGAPIAAAIPDLDVEAISEALSAEGRYAVEVSFRRKRRMLIIALTFTRADNELVVLECQNITRIRELESMIESYSAMVERNTRDIQREKERVEKLLLNIMPRNVYEEYKTFGVVTPQTYDPVAVLSLDFVDFGAMADAIGPSVVVSEINDIYAAFDRIGEQFGCERIKTVGDSYIAICGLPEPADNPAEAVANSAVRFVRYLARRNDTHPHAWRCRIGIAKGAVIGSVVGIQKYVYDVFGPAVNLAQGFRAHAGPMEIICAQSIERDVADGFGVAAIGERAIEDFGPMQLLRLEANVREAVAPDP